MNAHTPFDANQDWTNPYCRNSSNDPMVDSLLGNAYHVVRTVYCNLGNLKLLYDFLNQYGMVLGVQSEAELKALTADAKYARIYGFSRAGDRQVTDYLYVEGDRTGIIPNDPKATGSWITVATSGSNGGGTFSGEGAYIPWVYSNGSAIGGETTINVPDGTVGVPFIIVNGDMQYVGRGFEFNIDSLSVTLAQPLEEGDEVVFLLTGTPAVPDNPNVNDWIQINWLYNNGAAVGGEQVIAIPYTFQSVPAVYKNGLRLYKGLTTESYTADPDNQRILLTEPLATNDRLIVQIGGEAQVLEASDHTLQEVARAANVKDSEVILSTDTTQVLNGKKVIYDVVTQRIYGLPTLPTNVYINSVLNGQLTYSPGNITVTLLDSYQQQNARELWRRSLAEAGLTLVDGSFGEGATANSATDAVWYIEGGECYTWGGLFPKAIPVDSDPASTGGISNTAWKPVSSKSLRADIITNEALNSIYSREFNTVAEMAASSHLKPGMSVATKGFYTAGDGGGAVYEIGDFVANGYTIIQCSSGLQAKLRVTGNIVDVRQVGAKPDGTGPVLSTNGKPLYKRAILAIKRQQTVNGDVWSLDKESLAYVKATPDTATDNRAAFQYALSVANTVVASGSYKINGRIELDSFKTVKADGFLHLYAEYVNPTTSVYTDDIFVNSDKVNGNAYVSVVGGAIIEGNGRYFSASEILSMKVNDTYPNFYPGSGVKLDNVFGAEVEVVSLLGQYGVSVSAGSHINIHDCLTMYHYDDGITFSMNNSALRGAYDSKASTVERCTSLMNGCGSFASTGVEIDDTVGFVKVSNCICAGNSAGFDTHFHRNLDTGSNLIRAQAGIVFEDCIAFDNNCDPSLVTSDTTWVHNVGFRTGVGYGMYNCIFVRCHSNGHWNNEYSFTGSSNMERSTITLIDCTARSPSSEYLSHYTVKATVYAKFGVSLNIRGGDYDGGLQNVVRGENVHSINIMDKCTLRRAACFVDSTYHSSYATDITSGLHIDNCVLTDHYTKSVDRQGVRCTSGGYSISITRCIMEASTVALGVAFLYLAGVSGARIRVQDNICNRTGTTASQGRFLQILSANTKLHETNNTVSNFDMDLHWTAATGSTIMRSGQILESTPNAIFPAI